MKIKSTLLLALLSLGLATNVVTSAMDTPSVDGLLSTQPQRGWYDSCVMFTADKASSLVSWLITDAGIGAGHIVANGKDLVYAAACDVVSRTLGYMTGKSEAAKGSTASSRLLGAAALCGVGYGIYKAYNKLSSKRVTTSTTTTTTTGR